MGNFDNQKSIARKCLCKDPRCAKCITLGCEDDNCTVHTKENKRKRRSFYIVPQTDEQIEKNRKIIEQLRAKGLLQKYEKTFKFNEDGTVTEERK